MAPGARIYAEMVRHLDELVRERNQRIEQETTMPLTDVQSCNAPECHRTGTAEAMRWGDDYLCAMHRGVPSLVLTDAEIDFLIEALDSHEYWQLSESNERNDGASQIEDGENADVDFGRAIAHRLYQAKEGRQTLPAVRGLDIEPEDDDDTDDFGDPR